MSNGLVFSYDDAGNRTWVKRAHQSNLGDVYTYDASDQLTNVLYNASNPDTTPSVWSNSVGYVFDAAGNRTGVVAAVTGGTTNTTAYAANNLNQYTAVGGTNYTYDAKGNLTGDGVWTYSYDYENRLASATSSAGVPPVSITYTYDAFGRLLERRTSGSSTTTNRMYYAGLPANGFGAGWQLIDERDGTGTLVRKYVYGPGIDEPVRMTTSNGTKYYFEQDGLGNVTELASSIGAVIERYTYDVYGKPTIYNAGGSVIPSSALGNRLLFTGRDRDPDTGLYNFCYRYYSPSLGRFIQTDPIGIDGDDLNLYRYAENNPINYIDLLGLKFDPPKKGPWPYSWKGWVGVGGVFLGGSIAVLAPPIPIKVGGVGVVLIGVGFLLWDSKESMTEGVKVGEDLKKDIKDLGTKMVDDLAKAGASGISTGGPPVVCP